MDRTKEDKEASWHALRVFNNKVARCRDVFTTCNDVLQGNSKPSRDFPDELKGNPMEYYAPFVRETFTNRQNKQVVVEKPFIPSLFFFRSSKRQAQGLESLLSSFVRLYRHLHQGMIQPLAIPPKQMEMFIRATRFADESIDFYEDGAFQLKKGYKVRVIDGKFKGLEGEIKRIDGDHRLVVSLEGICTIVTAHIPRAYLEKL